MDGENDSLRTTAESLRSDEPLAPIRYTRLWVGLGDGDRRARSRCSATTGAKSTAWPRRSRSASSRPTARCSSPARTSRTARTSGSRWAARRSAVVWGHGAYVAPDWSADWLHREATWLLDHWARADHGKPLRRR